MDFNSIQSQVWREHGGVDIYADGEGANIDTASISLECDRVTACATLLDTIDASEASTCSPPSTSNASPDILEASGSPPQDDHTAE